MNCYREDHPFGPDGKGGFWHDLSVEIDAEQEDPCTTALAVVSGKVSFLPDTDKRSGSIILKPDLRAMEALNQALNIDASIVFVYRNLEMKSVTSATYWRETKDIGCTANTSNTSNTSNTANTSNTSNTAIAPSIVSTRNSEGMGSAVQNLNHIKTDGLGANKSFTEGRSVLTVQAGDALGRACPSGGRLRIGFEIVCVPFTGDEPGEEGWKRIEELISPRSLESWRLDPAAFYSTVASSFGSARLCGDPSDHALLKAMSKRVMIEIRDEHNLPFTGKVQISSHESSKMPTTLASPDGIFLLDSICNEEDAISREYSVSVKGKVLTQIPSGSSARPSPVRTMSPPAHWALQAISLGGEEHSYGDSEDCWFVKNDCPSLQSFTEGNRVTPVIDGLEILRQYVEAMRTVSDDGHFLYLSGWSLSDQFPLVSGDPESTFHALARKASSRGRVRALVWSGVGLSIDEVNRINSMEGGMAILDRDTLFLGSHHQKYLLVNGLNGPVAFSGGLDIDPDRLDSPNHGAPGPFHEIQARVEGPAVIDIHRCFIERWNYNPFTREPVDESPPACPKAGSVYVQVACTYAPKAKYSFAQSGTLTPLKALIRAIKMAKRFIYLEDQYLTPYSGRNPKTGDGDSLGILRALREALARIDYIIMVTSNHTDLPQCKFRRQQFIESLKAIDPGKVHVFYLAREKARPLPGEVAERGACITCSGGPMYRNEIYCHSKTWIVDDICAKIGSSNLTRRSYTYDSEMDLIMVDGALEGCARAFARGYRRELWAEHLNIPQEKSKLLDDHKLALSYWLSPPKGAHIRPYDHNAEIDLINTDISWDGILDPDGRV